MQLVPRPEGGPAKAGSLTALSLSLVIDTGFWIQSFYLSMNIILLLSGKSRNFSNFSLSFTFTLWFTETTKSTRWQLLFFFLIKTGSGLLAWIGWSIWISKSQSILCASISRFLDILFVIVVKFQPLAQFPVGSLTHLVTPILGFF